MSAGGGLGVTSSWLIVVSSAWTGREKEGKGGPSERGRWERSRGGSEGITLGRGVPARVGRGARRHTQDAPQEQREEEEVERATREEGAGGE